MKKFLLVGGVVAAFVAPSAASVTAHAAQYQVGGPDCYVLVDTLEPNIVIGGSQPPFFTMDPEGSVGAGVHCPVR